MTTADKFIADASAANEARALRFPDGAEIVIDCGGNHPPIRATVSHTASGYVYTDAGVLGNLHGYMWLELPPRRGINQGSLSVASVRLA